MQRQHQYSPLINTKAAADLLWLSERTLIRWRDLRKGPAYLKAGRRVLYRVKDIDDWLENHKAEMVGEAE